VRRDVYLEDISPGAAREIFRVALVGEGEALRVDPAATETLRRQALAERLGHEPRPYDGTRLPLVRHVTESLDLVARGDEPWLACSRCGQPLGPARENYKLHCRRLDRPIQAASPLIGEPGRFIDDAIQFRQFCCHACGRLIENEVSRAQDPVLQDIELEGR
jgi:N-methylhydantoinase B